MSIGNNEDVWRLSAIRGGKYYLGCIIHMDQVEITVSRHGQRLTGS